MKTKKQLVEQMKVVLSTTFAFYLKAHNFHWNVTGINFPQYHSFFETIYSEVYSSIDDIAEHIRALDAYAPGAFSRYMQLSTITDELNIPSSQIMCQKLYEDNQKVIECLYTAYKLAEENEECGLSNFLQDRIDKHKKHEWMLRSIVKVD